MADIKGKYVADHPTGLAWAKEYPTLGGERLGALWSADKLIPPVKNKPNTGKGVWFDQEGARNMARDIVAASLILTHRADRALGRLDAMITGRERGDWPTVQVRSVYDRTMTMNQMWARAEESPPTRALFDNIVKNTKGVDDIPVGQGLSGSASSWKDSAPYAEILTGVGADYLNPLIGKENSTGDPNASPGTSTATGLTQFVDDTWMTYMQKVGPQYGLKLDPQDAKNRNEILSLRADHRWNLILAGELAKDNAVALRESLGRDPSNGEVYMAHFGGSTSAAKAIKAAFLTPTAPAADFYSKKQVDANSFLFNKNGRALTVRELYNYQTGPFQGAFKITKWQTGENVPIPAPAKISGPEL